MQNAVVLRNEEVQAERLARPVSSALDDLLGTAFRVLDDGFIRVVDYMGTDDSVVQAARVSYGAGTKRVHEDRGLIRYLVRHRHTTPFEMCELKLHLRVPMDCWRQWIRHRTASVNEYSTRYSVAIDSAQRTTSDQWRLQASGNRQGSSGEFAPADSLGTSLTAEEAQLHRHAREVYGRRIASGIAREQSRKDLPLSTYTEAYWKIDLHNLLHFLELRMAPTAQHEIRQYAEIIGRNIVAVWCPTTWEAFLDYRLCALTLSNLEVDIVRAAARGDMARVLHLAQKAGLSGVSSETKKRSRELVEIEATLERLGLSPPWNTGR